MKKHVCNFFEFFSGFFMILPPFWTSKSDEKVVIFFDVFPYFMIKGILGAPGRSAASPGRHFGTPKAQFWGPQGVIWGKFCQPSGESFEKNVVNLAWKNVVIINNNQ